MRSLRPLLAALVVAAPLLVVGVGVRDVQHATWDAGFRDGRCLGPVCLITSPFLEISVGEYSPPLPATVPVNGVPVWGAPPSYTSVSGTSAGP